MATLKHAFTGKKFGIDGPQMANPMIRAVTRVFSAAEVIASATTPLLLVPAPTARQVLVFFGGVLQVKDGSANYDQNQNFIVKYQAAGGGATVSTTLANFLNGVAADVLGTIKVPTTDVVLEAGQPLVLTSSASPYNAAGDRQLVATTYYAIIDLEG